MPTICRQNQVIRRAALAIITGLLILPCQGQDIEPRRWSHLPVGGNFLGTAFAWTTGDISLDPVLRIENAEFELQTIAGKYIRSFELCGKSARIEVAQAYQSGNWTGLLDGALARADREGWGDTSVRMAVNLLGAPPLAGKEFAAYRAKAEHETIIGAGLSVQLPTGNYLDDKLINLGSNRFTFRPQLGMVHNRGKWSMELTASAAFFTDNDEFFNGRRLEQEPAYSADAHLIYTFRPGLWLAASAGYGGGGETAVNHIPSDNRQRNFAGGLGLGIPINRAVGLKFAWIALRTDTSTGADADTFTGAVSVAW